MCLFRFSAGSWLASISSLTTTYSIVWNCILCNISTPISTDLTEIPAESGRMNYKWIIFLSRCCAMIEVVSWQKASSALHTKHCTVHGPHTPIHHLLVRGPSKSRWTSDVELVQAQMMSVCPVASYRLCCLSCPGLNLTVLFYFHLSRPLPLSALTLVFLPKAAERVELLGCPLPSFPPQMVYLSLFFFFTFLTYSRMVVPPRRRSSPRQRMDIWKWWRWKGDDKKRGGAEGQKAQLKASLTPLS